jgi:hypothetical protein
MPLGRFPGMRTRVFLAPSFAPEREMVWQFGKDRRTVVKKLSSFLIEDVRVRRCAVG